MSRPNNSIRLDIVDCGHGNWNQVQFDDAVLIYDTGACQSYTRKDVRVFVKGRALASQTLPLYVVISHWDIDHYQALRLFTITELQKIKCVYVPNQIPNTVTYRTIKSRLDSAGVPIRALQPAAKLKSDRTIELVYVPSPSPRSNCIRLFRASGGHSRNQTGIVLGIVGKIKNALLTGDHHYPKLLDIAHHLPSKNPLILVVPHHGGHAGVPDAQAWLKVFSKIVTPISCGKNQWGHPYRYVTDQLSLMQSNKRPMLTKTGGTQSFLL
jgi:beta-lactamase superfamily II metal-dependent hydrolase